jgi:hypothetical protein
MLSGDIVIRTLTSGSSSGYVSQGIEFRYQKGNSSLGTSFQSSVDWPREISYVYFYYMTC